MNTTTVELKVGDTAPLITLKDDAGKEFSLKELRGKKVVLYFYPKDDTPGCTNESCDFRDHQPAFTKAGAVIIGVSVDSVASHQKFKKKHQLNFALLSDEAKSVVQAYGVWKEKSMYGRAYMGTERTTFIIDEKGKIAKVFPKVKVAGHAAEVLASLDA
jgi:thioredoxin-dependent peroxiredoxin